MLELMDKRTLIQPRLRISTVSEYCLILFHGHALRKNYTTQGFPHIIVIIVIFAVIIIVIIIFSNPQ